MDQQSLTPQSVQPEDPNIPQGASTSPSIPQMQPEDNKTATIITILLLIFLTPIGIIVMWIWPKWKTWVKVVVTVGPLILLFILGVLAAVILVAINPSAQFAKARNAKRISDTSTIQTAITQMLVEQRALPADVQAVFVSPEPVPFASASGQEMVLLCEYLTGLKGNETYVKRLPVDPKLIGEDMTSQDCQDFDTGYAISVTGNNVSVSAPLTEAVSGK